MAIDRTSKFAFVELREKAARRDAEGSFGISREMTTVLDN